jgi:PBP1b-binding outer membrane lipoprotein LpoB
MKRKLAAILLISTIVLSGCSSKGLTGSKTSDNSAAQNTVSGQTTAPGDKRVQVQTNFNSIKPGTIPQLTGVQKAQVDVKLNSTLKDLDSTLKSIQDAQDIDLSSVN